MRIGPLFKWYGSKWSGAKHYPAPIGLDVIEPFAGGAGYSLNHCDKKVCLYDDDPNLSILWPWLIDSATEAMVREIPCHLPIGTDIRTIGLSQGQAMLLKHWQRTNNVGDCWTTSPWGHLPGQWTENTRARVAEQVAAVKHWKFAAPSDYLSLHGATWYIDPPYLYNYRYRASLPDFDHRHLASWVVELPKSCLVIVCESAGKKGEVPDYLPFKESHRQVTSRRKTTQSHHSNELVYVRFPGNLIFDGRPRLPQAPLV